MSCIACWFDPCRCKKNFQFSEVSYDEGRMDFVDYVNTVSECTCVAGNLGVETGQETLRSEG